MIIQAYPDELDYVNAKLHPKATPEDPKVASFLECFLWACLRADHENYELLRPVLKEIMKKHPADLERLEMERRDSGR